MTNRQDTFIITDINKHLSFATFLTSQFIILVIGLSLCGAIYFYFQQNKEKDQFLGVGGTVTQKTNSISLEISSPDEDLLVFDSSLIISGKTSPNSQVLISTDSDDVITSSNSSGNFSTVFNLSTGVNNLTITAFSKQSFSSSKLGLQKSVKRLIFYSKEKLQ